MSVTGVLGAGNLALQAAGLGTRNDSDAALQLNGAAKKLINDLGIVDKINKGADPMVQLGILREAIQLYADQNNIDPNVFDVVSKNTASQFGVSGGLPSLRDAAQRNANESFPRENGAQNPLATRQEAITFSDGLAQARAAANNIDTSSSRPPVFNSNAAPSSGAQTLRNLAAQLQQLVQQFIGGNQPVSSVKANNGGSELQNARGEVADIRRTLGTDTEIATTGKKNMALAKLDTAIDQWAKDNNVPAGVVSLVKGEVARDIGTYNGKLTTANDEANRLALEKFPVRNDFMFGDTNASARANYANQIKSDIGIEAGAAVTERSTGTLSMLNQTLNAGNDLRDILGTDKEISTTGKKNAALAKLDAALDAWGAANNVPAGTLALAKSKIAQDIGTYNGKLTTVDDEANRLALEKFPPRNMLFAGDLNANNRANFVADYKKDVANQTKAAINELDMNNQEYGPRDTHQLLGDFERAATRFA
jgi:hypothetical protein